jgi:hypothetical protein
MSEPRRLTISLLFHATSMLSVCLCVCVFLQLTLECLNYSKRNLVSWTHLNGLFHKSLSSISVSICASHTNVAGQRLGKTVAAATNIQAKKELLDASFLCGPCHIKCKIISSQNFLFMLLCACWLVWLVNVVALINLQLNSCCVQICLRKRNWGYYLGTRYKNFSGK